MNENITSFLEKIKEELPEVKILVREEERLIYAHGCYPLEYKWLLQGKYKILPEAVLMPENTEAVSRIMALSEALSVGIIPFGGGSGIVGGSMAEVMIDIKELRDFQINPINCTATGGAGLTGADFENKLNEAGYTCGQYPQSFQSAVLGGMVATRAIGTFSTKYGKMDDMVNSLEVVLPNGHILNTHKAPKASTGPELDQLFLGSEGVYGIITKVEVKIYPIAEKRYFEAFTFERTEDGLEAIRQFIQNNVHPAVVRLYDEEESIPKMKKYGF
ncbi:MAG: FAD-binding oxidoreductase, partial [Eubacterium sp.]